eukprot:scaffold23969_cov26-Tisochrysis_lutea.AAC.4
MATVADGSMAATARETRIAPSAVPGGAGCPLSSSRRSSSKAAPNWSIMSFELLEQRLEPLCRDGRRLKVQLGEQPAGEMRNELRRGGQLVVHLA